MANVIDGFEIYFMEPVLGKGAYGTVYKAKKLDTGEPVAAKQTIIRSAATDLRRIINEVEHMIAVSHENLVKYLHHHDTKRGTVWVFLQLCDLGDLDQYFVDKNPDRQEYLQLMKQAATAIAYLHQENIVHRDIKPVNILLQSSAADGGLPVVKIADFGLARLVDIRNSGRRLSYSSMNVGTEAYMAPELFFATVDGNLVRCDESVDIFALGITFFAIICFDRNGHRLIPYEDLTSRLDSSHGRTMSYKRDNGELEKAKSYHEEVVEMKGDDLEREIRILIRKMIPYDSTQRVKASDVLNALNEIITKSDSTAPEMKDLSISDPNVINLHSQNAQDGIEDLLPTCGEYSEVFNRKIPDFDRNVTVWGKEITTSSEAINKFRIGMKKQLCNGVQWVFGVIQKCSPRDDHSDCLIWCTFRVEGVNYKGCESAYLYKGEIIAPVSHLDNLPSECKLIVTLHSHNISPADLLAHQRPPNYVEVALPQGRKEVCRLTVNWTVDDWRTLMNCTPGNVIHSKLFGDPGKQVIMCAKLFPNGNINYPEGTVSVYLKMVHLPNDSRGTKMTTKVTYKIAVNGVSGRQFLVTYRPGVSWGHQLGSHSDFNTKELNIVLEVESQL